MLLRIALLLLFSGSACAQSDFRHDLRFSQIPTRWDEALPLGNGMVGVLIWQKDGKLRLALDRADLWDLRSTADLDKLDFAAVRRHVESNTYEEVQRLGDVPYERDPAPTKIPGASLEFDTGPMADVVSAKVNIRSGLAQIAWRNDDTFISFVHPELPIGWFRFDRTDIRPTLIPPRYGDAANKGQGNSVQGQGLARLGYSQGMLSEGGNHITYIQPGWNGFEYQVAVSWKVFNGKLEGVWAITSNYGGKDESTAESLAKAAIGRLNQDMAVTEDWWAKFWSKSSISLPDSILERQWYLEQYKFGCVARANTPPITLQAIWTADNGNLPPWKGDIHNDLNLQLSYWPAYSSNHLREAEGMVNWLHSLRPEFERWTRDYFDTSGLNVPGVCTLDGKPMGGWIQYSLSPTTAGWLGHHFYLHWRYSMDRTFLKEKAYPWVRDFSLFIQNISVAGGNGTRKLPLSSSPEFYDNSVKAWFHQTTNYDLAIIRWSLEKAAEMAAELGLTLEASNWKKELARWPSLAVDIEGGLSLAPGHPYPGSHRHFSHLLGIHPLGLLRYEHPMERKIIDFSLQTLMSKGTQAWVGYSFAWLGSLYARTGNGAKAAEALRTFASCFCLSNSFHANGDQCGGRNSSYTYRPFTLEGNFAFAAGIQEMLLQSHDGAIRIFPAVPAEWKEVSFKDLRAEGGFLISADRSGGRLTELTVKGEAGGEVVLEDIPSDFNLPAHARREGNRVRFQMERGQELTLKGPQK
jgi:alpha-L-fucosidase 2